MLWCYRLGIGNFIVEYSNCKIWQPLNCAQNMDRHCEMPAIEGRDSPLGNKILTELSNNETCVNWEDSFRKSKALGFYQGMLSVK